MSRRWYKGRMDKYLLQRALGWLQIRSPRGATQGVCGGRGAQRTTARADRRQEKGREVWTG